MRSQGAGGTRWVKINDVAGIGAGTQTLSTTLCKFGPPFPRSRGIETGERRGRWTLVHRERKSGADLGKAVSRASETPKVFKGRVILPGSVEGEALVTHVGFNAYASFSTSIHTPVEAAHCADSSNPELYGKNLTGKILCLPKTTGSTSAGAVWQRVAQMGIAPKAMLFSQRIDSLAAGGLIVADVWAGKRIVTVDQLGDEFLETVKDGDRVVIRADGTVTIQ